MGIHTSTIESLDKAWYYEPAREYRSRFSYNGNRFPSLGIRKYHKDLYAQKTVRRYRYAVKAVDVLSFGHDVAFNDEILCISRRVYLLRDDCCDIGICHRKVSVMADDNFANLISNNSVLGASIAAALAMLHKVWQILKKDRKEDNLDNAERSLRDELRQELKVIKEENVKLREENNILHQELAELKASFVVCKKTHPDICPLFKLREIEHG